MIIRLTFLCAALIGSLAVMQCSCFGDNGADVPHVSFFKDIRPILQAKCQGCHQPAKPEGGYVMTTLQSMTIAGDSGRIGIVPGKPEKSFIIDQVTPDADGHAAMPQSGQPLVASEIDLIRRWIEAGAYDDTPESAGQKIDTDHPPVYSRQPVITSLDFSPDGRWLAVTGFHEVLLFDTANLTAEKGQPDKRFVGLSERVERVRFSPDGSKLLVTGGNPSRMGEVQIWDVNDGTLIQSVPVSFDTVFGGCWSPDGTVVAFGCTDNTIRAIDVSTGEQVLYQGAHEDWVLDTVFAPKGDHIISVGRDMTVKLTEFSTQRFIDNITSITPGALRGGLAAVDRHPMLDHVVVAGSDGTPRMYRIHRHSKRVIGDDANHIFDFFPIAGRVFDVRFSSDGKRVVAAGGLNGVGHVVVASYQLEKDVPQNILDIMAKVPGEQGKNRKGTKRSEQEWKTLDTFRENNTKKLADIRLSSTAYAVAFDPNSSAVVVAGSDGVVRFFDAVTGKPGKAFPVVELDTTVVTQASLPLPWPQEPSIEPEHDPNTGHVKAITIDPPSVALEGPFDATQVIVFGELDDGRSVDLTRQVVFQSGQSDLVSIGQGGLMRPIVDGEGSLRVLYHPSTNASNKNAQILSQSLPVRVSGTDRMPEIDFIRDVNPMLSKMGCNQGTCHGAAKGKNGFKLSLRGYDPIFDARGFTDDHGSRRVNLASPDDSLMLLKASATVPHTGGLLAQPSDPSYQVIRRWIEQGAQLDLNTPEVVSLEVFPPATMVDLPGQRQQFRVVATYADESRRDVTRQAFLESGNTEVATVDATGLVTALRRGEAPILVRYEGVYASVQFTVMGNRDGFQWKQPESWGPIDDMVAQKWRSLKIEPAPLASDIEFLRRVTIDLTGLPPSARDVRSFEKDKRDSRVKRAELVAGLIGSEAFIEHATNKWADLLQVNPKFLGKEGADGLRKWIREQVSENTPYDQFARSILTASGSNREHPAAAYFKTLRDPLVTMENTTQLFLGVRFNCNKCHDHPFERWTQDQYYETAASFAHVRISKDPESKTRTIGGTAVEGAKPLWEVVSDDGKGDVIHERTGKPVALRFPFDCEYDAPKNATRRQQFAAWITSPDNEYFAKSYVNRLWGYLFGAGIIDPIDDIRAGNPPTNPALLDYLTRTFVESGFDVRKVLSEICTSRTYSLSISKNRWNQDDTTNFSRAIPRRLPAETLFDALHAVVGSPTRFPGYPAGTRAAALPDVSTALGGGFLQTFGRPVRESACECERASGMALGPVMALVSGPAVGNVLADTKSTLATLVASQPNDALLVEEVFLRILNRPHRPEELAAVKQLMEEIKADHALLVEELTQAESDWKVVKQKREHRRQVARDAILQQIADGEKTFAPTRAKLAGNRAEEFAKALAARESYYFHPENAQRSFEKIVSKAPRWQLSTPITLTSSIGAKLTTLEDKSVLVSGKSGVETTSLSFELNPANISLLTGLRLELIPDPGLPAQGSGRAKDGNCVVTEIVLELAPVSSPGDLKKIKLHRPQADFAQTKFNVSFAIDDDRTNAGRGWAVAPQQSKYHWAVFELKEPISLSEPMKASVKIEQRFRGAKHAIGRFRIAFTDSNVPLKLGVSQRATDLVALPPGERSQEQREQLMEIMMQEDPAYQQATRQLVSAIQPISRPPELLKLDTELEENKKPVEDDPALVRLRSDVHMSKLQMNNYRLTAIQDLAWALINSPAFFFNH